MADPKKFSEMSEEEKAGLTQAERDRGYTYEEEAQRAYAAMSPEEAARRGNVGGGDKFLQAITFGLHDPYKNAGATGRAEFEARKAREAVIGRLNTSAWDAPTNQQQILDSLAQGYNQGVAGGQAQLSRMLMDQAQGKGDSIAQRQLRAGADENLRNALAMQGAQRGAGAQGAQRLAALQHSQIGNQLNQEAGLLRLQEQQGAQRQLAGLYGQMGAQNLGNLGLGFNIGEANRGAGVDRERYLAALRQNEAAIREARYQEARGNEEGAANAAKEGLAKVGQGAAYLAGL